MPCCEFRARSVRSFLLDAIHGSRPCRRDRWPVEHSHALRKHRSKGSGSRRIRATGTLERKIKSLIRWNAMAMVARANKTTNVGGHIATFASAATLYEVGFNHFFRGRTRHDHGDIIYFQGHASPGQYARAFLEGRLERTAAEELPAGTAAGRRAIELSAPVADAVTSGSSRP